MIVSIGADLNREKIKEWKDFVENHPHGNVFQTPYMFRVYVETKDYQPLLLSLQDDSGALCGVLLVLIQDFIGRAPGTIASRALIFGGPLVKDNEPTLLRKLLNQYSEAIKEKAIYTEVRNSFRTNEHHQVFSEEEYQHEDHLNILVYLSKSEDQLWKEVHSKRRNEIRRASREGTVFGEAQTEEEVRECYSIISQVYKKAKLPLADSTFFLSAFRQSGDDAGLKVFTASNDGMIIGTMFTLYFGKVMYDYYAGSLSQYYHKYPNDLIPWEVFLWGKKNGYTLFDFGGAGKPNIAYGVRDYKKKFGGEIVNFGRYKRIHQPVKMRLAETAFQAWKLLKGI